METKILILGLGNELQRDDGAGIHAARLLKERLSSHHDIDVKYGMFSGIGLLYEMLGYNKVVIIDAMSVGKAGEIKKLNISDLPSCYGLSFHDMNLKETIEFGKRYFPKEVPSKIVVFAICVKDVTFREGLSQEIKGALPQLVNDVLKEVL